MKKLKIFIILHLFLGATFACRESTIDENDIIIEKEIDTPDWTENTHSNAVEPNYEVVFPEDQVLQLYITLDDGDWSKMQNDLASNLGGNHFPGGRTDIDFDPIWVAASLVYEGTEWYKVGIRYKGNSSLKGTYSSNSDKYSFKLDFDEFEDEYPDIKNQRFFGFKQLNLNNNYDDDSFVREKTASDLFRSFGVPSARTTFCQVYIDKGNGSEYLGLYTIVEEVDDTVLDAQFENGEGNLYKPDGDAATFASGTYNQSEMEIKTNEESSDYSDVRALYEIINATTRDEGWQEELENIFDVDHFLKYLAVNTVIQNWDTYGNMTHNFYLYNHNGKLVWIPWDNNEAFQEGKMQGALSLGLTEVEDFWPLIRYIIDVPSYEEQYQAYVKDFSENYFTHENMQNIYMNHSMLIQEYAQSESWNFEGAINELVQHVSERTEAVNQYLK
ncbi:CotH kinase family protein [Sediminitomix flava]|uniref:CotH protein n=1 Tax=Sediminitomix flava TaxID=379075 RepID=A0A315ZHS9_SEDFL|nr:CotH kinase family protein [Sediminitomix flava]PWJ45066.1 CotH protein [Sediminitomix flava]